MSDKITSKLLKNYIDELASSASTPGGGNAISLVNIFAASLMQMSLRIAVLKKSPSDVAAVELEKTLEKIKENSETLAAEDSLRFKKVMSTWKAGGSEYERALYDSAEVSLDIAAQSLLLLKLIDNEDIDVYRNIITDVGISVEMALSSFKGGLMNYAVNAKFISDKQLITELNSRAEEMKKAQQRIYSGLIERISGFLE